MSALKIRKKLQRFWKKNNGSASIEFLFWVPTFVFILMLTIDASLLFMTQSNYWSITRDTARIVARHAMTAEQAETYAATASVNSSASAIADVQINGQSVTVSLTSPATNLVAFNVFGFASLLEVRASTTQAVEPI